MPTPTTYINDIRDIADTVTGNTAPTTGQYYNHIYSQDDPDTGVPTLGVELYQGQGGQSSLAPSNIPLPINNLTDAQILEMIQDGKQVENTNKNNTLDVNPSINGQYTQVQKKQNTQIEQGGQNLPDEEIPIAGLFMLVFLLLLAGFVYFIIRTWQNHQAQKKVMMNIKKTSPNTPKGDLSSVKTQMTKGADVLMPQVAPPITTEASWRTEVEQAGEQLKNLLDEKGIEGQTISDKLKSVRPGQFALADLAWEAQQGAKDVLTAHDTDVSEKAIKRTLQLFKQVFAEHNVV